MIALIVGFCLGFVIACVLVARGLPDHAFEPAPPPAPEPDLIPSRCEHGRCSTCVECPECDPYAGNVIRIETKRGSTR